MVKNKKSVKKSSKKLSNRNILIGVVVLAIVFLLLVNFTGYSEEEGLASSFDFPGIMETFFFADSGEEGDACDELDPTSCDDGLSCVDGTCAMEVPVDICGDGTCDSGETMGNCPMDCDQCTNDAQCVSSGMGNICGPPADDNTRYCQTTFFRCNGDGICDQDETVDDCPSDCDGYMCVVDGNCRPDQFCNAGFCEDQGFSRCTIDTDCWVDPSLPACGSTGFCGECYDTYACGDEMEECINHECSPVIVV